MRLIRALLAACILLQAAGVQARVLLGLEAAGRDGYADLRGKRVGLITNHTGRNRAGKSTIDLLHRAPGVRLVALFSPEHGIRGTEEHGKRVSDARDAKTGLPVYSLYGATTRPTEEMLAGIDVLVFDIQDVGTRFYTYITTLAFCMEEAAKNDIQFIVFDRPNPIRGDIVEGEVLGPSVRHFTAYLQVPVRHGLTVGEIAAWHNAKMGLDLDLGIIRMEGWERGMAWEDTGLKFRPPSPNIRTPLSALLYPGIGAFEAANVAVGRGTGLPFELFGAPWMDGKVVAERLTRLDLKGFKFEPVRFKPKADIYRGRVCGGVRVKVEDGTQARPVDLFICAFVVLRELYPGQFQPRWPEVERVTGSSRLKHLLETRQSLEAILSYFHEQARGFEAARQPYLLY